MKTFAALLITALALSSAVSAEPPYSDDFAAAKKEDRRAVRGPWKFAGNVATCTQDDELYKKFKDHGPVTWWDIDFTDGTVAFSFKADPAVKTVVFTINDAEGHVFRFVSSERRTLIKAFAREGDGVDDLLNRKGPPLKHDVWLDAVVTFKGDKATVKIGEFEETVSHPAIARGKSTIGVGFSFGTLQIKDFSVK